MGPGYVPHMLAYIMMVLGLIIAVVALYGGGEVVEAPKWKPITMVTIGIVVFALLFETTGMFPSLVALVLISSL
ncbi:tripartite tricarboxylate transporter TctB family protein, partial [Streptomyces turgidiscabies]|uniref:tripartite tricarboxylate transporter TctB family protein n=1 Tax=Streptomyces turgidiscabies TaxID=85558 RepID=UPI0038F5FF10